MPILNLHELLSRRLLLVGGKGGVGKTTIASALGVMAARQGKKCLLVSTDPAHSLGDAFGLPIGAEMRPLRENLDGVELDPDAEAALYVSSVSQRMKLFASVQMHEQIERQMALVQSSPGAVEAALLERTARIMTETADGYDIVIFDTAPTGHTLRLLHLPEAMAAWTEGLLASSQRSTELGQAVANLSERRLEAGIATPVDDPHERTFEGADRRTRRIAEILLERRRLFYRCRRLLKDQETTGFVFVVTAERLPVLETARAVAVLKSFGMPVAGLIINRLMPSLEGAFFRSRVEQEEIYLSQLNVELAGIPQLRLPMLDRDVNGIEALDAFAGLLVDRASSPPEWRS
jgi:arsenite/tail-anchored protein-transporting ATPase